MKVASLALLVFAAIPTTAACPPDAVFVALANDVRGYSLRANGAVQPCQVISGNGNYLGGMIAAGSDGTLHLTRFLSISGQVEIFGASANGNVAPLRTALTFSNDHVSLTTDPSGNDYVLARETVVFLPNGTIGEPSARFTIPAGSVTSIASDADGNLVLAGWDQNGAVFINTLNTSLNKTAPVVLRKITGLATGLFTETFTWGSQPDLQIAVDPGSNELYVYNALADRSKVQISVFAAGANGNVAPIRTLAGSATLIGPPGGLGGGTKIAVSSDGRLFVSEENRGILVFAPGASGNVAPSQIIIDASLVFNLVPQGGIAVRSCTCRPRPSFPHR